ncbi:CRISPR-associated protein Cse1 [Roseibium aquae]|uniref:CRISPR-associated protein Cse1 n=1 Tax=Roseibium aquae TaxID=1323746 RepID=A0A916TL40_9HYPH|nr:CRISPR-associated protein Cse1 [Roseibium aquae]GGB49175.1 CRISPR-associated protein Cse1 [Roseibium aquae]
MNLLTEPLIQTDKQMLSLPGLLAAMARGEVASFPALRPHQRPAWHMFLVQLATLALSNAGVTDLPDNEDSWSAALRGLTADFPDDAPWHLVVEDRRKPAFFQPPDPGGLKWQEVTTPDALDMLITSRNHDLKRKIAYDAAPQDWIFALISLQTMEGFGGAGNYGVARMNGGSSSRIMIALAPITGGGSVIDTSAWWRREVKHLLSGRSGLSGQALLWCRPWPEGQLLDLIGLDPLFIEVCRRVRLVNGDTGLHAQRTTSKAARIAAKEANGMTQDPWAPVHLAEAKTLTLGERDWTYGLLSELLYSGKWQEPRLVNETVKEKNESMVLVAEAFARGNSKTDGFKSRVIPVPKAVRKEMFGTRAIDLSDEQIKTIDQFDKALRDGLALIAAQGDREKRGKAEYARTAPARAALHRLADSLFFPALWDKLAAGSEDGRKEAHMRFVRRLAQAAREEFNRAVSGIPCAQIMRPRAEVRGRAELNARLTKIFKDIGVKEFENV